MEKHVEDASDAAGMAVVCINIAILLRHACRVNWMSLLHTVRFNVCGFVASLHSRRRGRIAMGSIEDHVTSKMRELQLHQMRSALKLLQWGLSGGFLFFVLVEQTGQSEHNQPMSLRWACVAILVVVTLVYLFPNLLSTKTIELWYTAIMVCTVVSVSPWSATDYATHANSLKRAALRMIPSVGRMHTKSVVAWNSIHFVMAACTFGRASSHPSMDILGEGCLCLALIVVVFLMEQFALAEIKQSGEARSWKEQLGVLLSMMCDVQMEVDPQGRIVGDSTTLAALVSREPARSLDGAELSGFMPNPEDRHIFREKTHLASPLQVGDHHAVAFHVDLRHSSGRSVKMELFSLQSRDFQNKVRHLIGMREFGDADSAAQQRMAGQQANAIADNSANNQVAVEVDISQSTVSVRQCTFEFLRLCGLISTGDSPLGPGSSLISFVDNPAEFVRWLQSEMNPIMAGQIKDQTKTFSLSLRPPIGQPGQRINATCSLAFGNRALPQDGVQVWLVLRGIQHISSEETSAKTLVEANTFGSRMTL